MEIRNPKYIGYKRGNLDKNVKITSKLKKEEFAKRNLKEPKNQIDKLRNEIWFPNIDITNEDIKTSVDKIRGTRILKNESEDVDKESILIYIHGGGFYGGSVENSQNTCKYITEQLKIKTISVDYSLAPEFPYPTALNEIHEIVKYYSKMYKNIYIAGDSAGANLACATVIKDIFLNTNNIKGLIMFYPVLLIDLKDNIMSDFVWDIKEYEFDEKSEDINLMKSESLGLKYAMPFIKSTYIQTDEEKDNPLISPICLKDEYLQKFPKTLIFTAEYDYLRLEAEYFVKRLKANNKEVKGIRYAGEIHAYMDKIGYNENVIDTVKSIKEYFNF